MTTSLLTDATWDEITKAVRASPRKSAVAVAYFGAGASRMLPLAKGSVLVVDASDSAVRSGLTCPDDLTVLAKRGVRVYSAENLHAKIVIVNSVVFVGSGNASHNSASTLIEATLRTSDRAVVSAARRFLSSLRGYELGPESLARLRKIYRPPQRWTRGPKRRKGRRLPLALPRLLIAQLRRKEPPRGSEAAEATGERHARRKRTTRRHQLEWFYYQNSPFREGDRVVQVVEEDDGRRMVSPPGTVIHVERWRSYMWVFVEVPKKNRISVRRLARRLGRKSRTRLERGGLLAREFADNLSMAWRE